LHQTLSAYSEALGIAYQIRDDIDDLVNLDDGDDLTSGRPSFPLSVALERAKDADAELLDRVWTRTGEFNPGDVREMMHRLGAIDRSKQMMESYKDQAVRTLTDVPNPSLKGLLRRVVSKIFGVEIQGWCSEFEKRNKAMGEEVKTAG
jgi:geranylgeranyl pyrophosphate synthase